jgi:hypothetical protein
MLVQVWIDGVQISLVVISHPISSILQVEGDNRSTSASSTVESQVRSSRVQIQSQVRRVFLHFYV